MSSSLLSQGANLMLLGMGTVFAFLTILVFAMRFMSALVLKCLPEDEVVISPPAPSNLVQNAPVEPRVLSVIQAAIDAHKGKHS